MNLQGKIGSFYRSQPFEFFDDFAWAEGGTSFQLTPPLPTLKWFIGLFPASGTPFFGSTTSTEGGKNGRLHVASGNVAGNNVNVQLNGNCFVFQRGRRMYFESMLRVSTVAASTVQLVVGLFSSNLNHYDNMATSVADGFGFTMSEDGDLEYVIRSGSAGSKTDTSQDITAATDFLVAGYYDGGDNIKFYLNGTLIKTIVSLPANNAHLTPTFNIGTGTTTSVSLIMDYFGAWVDRV